MNADSIEGPKASKPAWVLPIIGSSALIVLVCLVAYFGPQAYRAWRVAPLVRELEASGRWPAYRVLYDLRGMRCPQAEAALRNFARAHPPAVWVPESGIMVLARQWRSTGVGGICGGDPEPGDSGNPGLTVLNLDLKNDRILWHYGVEIRRMEWTGQDLLMDFVVNDLVAGRLKVEKGRTWTMSMGLREACRLPDRAGVIRSGTGRLPEEVAIDNYVRDWLRKAGALPAEEPAVKGAR